MPELRLGGFTFDTLVGHTGFVGRNLADAFSFRHLFNSANSAGLKGLESGGIVCAGLYAEKWRANAEPEADLAHVRGVFDLVSSARAQAVLLISTVDIYDPPLGRAEGEEPDPAATHPYGRHRQMFEQWMRERFPNLWILRLPGLFGPHLKKNLIFDMMQGRLLEKIHPEGQLQWVDIRRMAGAIERMDSAGIRLLNMVTEPVFTRDVQEIMLPGAAIGSAAPPVAPHYDLRTRHSAAFGRDDGYTQGRDEVLADLRAFAAEHSRA